VLVVGDSLEVGTGPYLQRELAGTDVSVDARTGRPSGEGVRVLAGRLQPGHDVVVFDMGVNDSPSSAAALASDLAAARRLAGKRCMVVATVQRPPLNGVSVAGLNRAVESFATRDQNAQLVDWHAAAAEQPSLLNPDRVHPTPAGYAARGRLVADSVRACLEQGSLSSGPPSKPAEPPPPLASPSTGSRPLLIDWRTLGGTPPLRLVAATGRAVAGAGARALAEVAEGGSEPVLGR
jgi:lysophospholipase L1-like esterase